MIFNSISYYKVKLQNKYCYIFIKIFIAIDLIVENFREIITLNLKVINKRVELKK